MIWYDDLFVGESISPRKKKRIIRRLRRRSPFNSAYVLTLASNPDNLIDIIQAKELCQRYYPRRRMVVIGLAGDYAEAMQLAGNIIYGIYCAQGDFELRRFIMKNIRQSRAAKAGRREDGMQC